MNDDFLHEMREPPRPEFLAQLKGKLDQRTLAAQPRQRRSFSFIRGLITGLLLAGAGLAIAAATLNDMPAALRVLVRAPVQFLARVLPGGGGPRSSEQAKSQDHHGAVPLHQEGEGRLVPLRAEPPQEFGVGLVPGLVGLGHVPQVSENDPQGFSRHGCAALGETCRRYVVP